MKYPLFYLSLLLFPLSLHSAQLPAGFVEQQIATGLDPTTLTIAPDGRVFIAEKSGRIRIVEDDTLLPDPFLSIEVDNYNERGLSGLVLDPDFEANNYFYVFYTVPGGNYNRISRFTANGNHTLPNSETILFELAPLSGTIHNGGAMVFGNDGKLYIAVGDGADPQSGQDLNTTLGKMLRINPDGSIPEDNPFYNELSGQQRAIYAYGFRNPFTMAVDPVTGTIMANDVGSNNFEEVNAIIAGGNYGWALQEGPGAAPFPDGYVAPLHAYDHGVGCAVIGSAFYQPTLQQFPPEYTGRYFFADYCEGIIWTMDPSTGSVYAPFATGIERPIALHTAPDGSLYYIERRGLGGGSEIDNTSTANGVLWKVSYTGSGAPFVAVQPQPVLRVVGETAHFSCTASGAPTLSYQWQRDDIDIPGATDSILTLPAVTLADDGSAYRCRISNGEGEVWTSAALLSVTANNRPIPEITLPATGLTYRAGDVLVFEGTAVDPEEGALSPEQLTWRIDFHHDDHTHPGLSPQTGGGGNFNIPVIGETSPNVWYRIHLTATDAEGLSQSIYQDVLPEKRNLELLTDPPGLQLRLDGRSLTTPQTEEGVVGVLRSLQAPSSQVIDNVLYTFNGWANAGADPLLSFAMPEADQTFLAYYEEAPLGTGTGLTGAYYNSPVPDFSGNPAFWRIDTTIQFDWGGSSAAPALLGTDFYSIQWTGSIEVPFSETYTFYTHSDDGARLWVNEELIIDQWVPQPPTEVSGEISLQAGQRYAIRLEYFEEGGGAVCELRWSSLRTPKDIIPKSQLYPNLPSSDIEARAAEHYQILPQPARESATLWIKTQEDRRFHARLYHINGQEVWRGIFQHLPPVSQHNIPVSALPAGLYVLQLQSRTGQQSLRLLVD
ncbi:MAG: PQQ-dependent sugar dehydrogenase [Phaeodactylibacter xiamenensis]|uniref:PA14 domain-containing protein n=1 Tax=Phaeodactylibacter xiamenensis TaxID=1524460 RepID=A0A098S6F7_9BACT|nr:PQQ-dependent sugar dehydrogenase [Phaeodactylibacter xiamenensis]KGE87720.1 hypothetical protein IX84_13145 [Phaeodactylibacter xiamenensis]MCR9052588.1 PQQ-dependent sugar dehydrogenase [bacterium]